MKKHLLLVMLLLALVGCSSQKEQIKANQPISEYPPQLVDLLQESIDSSDEYCLGQGIYVSELVEGELLCNEDLQLFPLYVNDRLSALVYYDGSEWTLINDESVVAVDLSQPCQFVSIQGDLYLIDSNNTLLLKQTEAKPLSREEEEMIKKIRKAGNTIPVEKEKIKLIPAEYGTFVLDEATGLRYRNDRIAVIFEQESEENIADFAAVFNGELYRQLEGVSVFKIPELYSFEELQSAVEKAASLPYVKEAYMDELKPISPFYPEKGLDR